MNYCYSIIFNVFYFALLCMFNNCFGKIKMIYNSFTEYTNDIWMFLIAVLKWGASEWRSGPVMWRVNIINPASVCFNPCCRRAFILTAYSLWINPVHTFTTHLHRTGFICVVSSCGPSLVQLVKDMEPNMEYIVAQVTQKEVGRRFQVGPEIIDYILDRHKSRDLEQDQTMLDRMMDSLATSWVNSSNFKVSFFRYRKDNGETGSSSTRSFWLAYIAKQVFYLFVCSFLGCSAGLCFYLLGTDITENDDDMIHILLFWWMHQVSCQGLIRAGFCAELALSSSLSCEKASGLSAV